MPNPHEEPWQETQENFEVIMRKRAVSPGAATPDDYKRVPVRAPSTIAAVMHQSVQAHVDYVALQAVPPGQNIQEEVLARQRQILGDQPPLDRSLI